MRAALLGARFGQCATGLTTFVIGESAVPTGARQCSALCAVRRAPFYFTLPWSDVRLPAELKHITKRRRRKQP